MFVIQIEDKKLKINCELETFNLFLQEAFKIRGFSRKQLQQRKRRSISSLKEVWILPEQSWDPVPQLILFAVTGTDFLSEEKVCTLEPPVIMTTTLLFVTSIHKADFSWVWKIPSHTIDTSRLHCTKSRNTFDSNKKKDFGILVFIDVKVKS